MWLKSARHGCCQGVDAFGLLDTASQRRRKRRKQLANNSENTQTRIACLMISVRCESTWNRTIDRVTVTGKLHHAFRNIEPILTSVADISRDSITLTSWTRRCLWKGMTSMAYTSLTNTTGQDPFPCLMDQETRELLQKRGLCGVDFLTRLRCVMHLWTLFWFLI